MTPDLDRLARAIKAACKARGWLQEDLIRESTIGRSTIQRLWKGAAGVMPTPGTKRQLEETLGWGRGSVDAILAGGDPTSSYAQDGSEDSFVLELRKWPGLSDEKRERFIAAYLQNKRERMEAAAAMAERLVRPLAEAAALGQEDTDPGEYPESSAS